MPSIVSDLAVAVIELLHVALLPAGVGLVLALVVASRQDVPVVAGSDEARLQELRALIAAGGLGSTSPTSGPPTTAHGAAHGAAHRTADGAADGAAHAAAVGAADGLGARPDPVSTRREASTRAAIQLAVLGSACSAVVHAMAGPPHAAENMAFGVFFELAAIAQFAWAGLALLAPERRLWVWGIPSNAVLILLWLVTRTYGLPFGLLDGPEAVGRWDLASKVWEVLALGCCWWLIRPSGGVLGRRGPRTGSPPIARLVPVLTLVSLAALLALALSGPPT